MQAQAQRNRMQVMGNAIGLPSKDYELEVLISCCHVSIIVHMIIDRALAANFQQLWMQF